MKDSRSEHKSQNLNARLLRFRSQPESEDAHSLAEALLAAQRYADVRVVTTAAQAQGEDAALLVLEGRSWLQERDLVRAQAVLLRAVRAAPELQPAFRWLGETLLKRGDPQRAAKTLHRALALDPEDAESAKLAARAEYLAEAANDGLETVPPAPDSAFDSERAVKPRSVNPPAPAADGGGRARSPQPSAASPLPAMPEVLRERDARASTPESARSAGPGRSSFGARPPAKPFMPNSADATRPRRGPGFHDPPTEPTSEFRRLPPARAPQPSPPAPAPPAARAPSPPEPARGPTLPSLKASPPRASGGAPEPPNSLANWRSGGPAAPPAAGVPNKPERPVAHARFEPASAQPRRDPPPAARGAQPSGQGRGAEEVVGGRSSRAESPGARGDASGRGSRPDSPSARGAGSAPDELAAGRGSRPELPNARGRGSAPDQLGTRSSRPDLPSAQGPSSRPALPKAARPAPRRQPAEESSPALDVSAGMVTLTSDPPPPLAAMPELGSELGQPVDADDVLGLVQRLGLFEPADAAPAAWAASAEVEPRGQRLRNALIVVWGITLVACVAGYFGWNAFVDARHARAAQWVAQARALALRGDHGGLVDAERVLRLAREQHPALVDIPREALLIQLQRVVDDGERDMAALQSAFSRARAAGVTGPSISLGNAILSAASGEPAARDSSLAQALGAAQGDARLVYLVGRTEQRAGHSEALAHLQAAAQANPKLAPAQIALAELAYENGDREAALAAVNAALAADAEQLRARLFRMYLMADDADPAQVQSSLASLGLAMEKAGSIDHALVALVRARLLRRQGQNDAAGAAVEAAGSAGAAEPRLVGWVAREALALGKLTLAQHLASQALSAAPEVAQNRRLLARILIERNDGEHALQLLDKLPPDDVEAQIMKAQAALLSSDPAALKAAFEGLGQIPGVEAPAAGAHAKPPIAKRELNTRVGALRIRIEAKLNPSKAVVDRARALARSAPGDPEALLALAEAALASHDPVTAQNALKQRFAVAPDDPNAHCMLGRARRMAVDVAGAEASFRRALELAPGHGEAMTALAGLLLDEGKFAEADAVYQELATRGGSALLGRLGRVDALTALGRYADAQVQLAAVSEAQQNSAGYRLSAARLALARNKPGDALALLRPLVDEQGDKVQVMALYGDALCAAEQLDAATDAYNNALSFDNELPEALLGRGDVLLREKKVNEALPFLQKAKDALAHRIRPPSLQARRLILLGKAYIERNKRGDLESGRSALREASELPGAPAEAFYFLAEALGGKANPEARAAYQRYLELEPNGRYRDRARRGAQ